MNVGSIQWSLFRSCHFSYSWTSAAKELSKDVSRLSILILQRTLKNKHQDFPGGPVAKTLPNAEESGSIPGQGIRSHMQQLIKSSHAPTKDPTRHN